MKNFNKDRVLLLKELQKLVSQNLKYSNVNAYDDEDIAELVIVVKDIKQQRLLKKISKAMDEFIKEFIQEQKWKLQEAEYNKKSIREVPNFDSI
jgi:hypothetical protein